MLYFAHGTYIDLPQMRVCCPSAELVATGRIHDYRLCFPRWSMVRNSAVAGIEPATGGIAWGALYEVSPQDLERLDLLEGYIADRDPGLNGSTRVSVQVERPDGLTVEAVTHVAVPMDEPGRPSLGYLLVLARAAKALEFPDAYIAQLKTAEAAALAA